MTIHKLKTDAQRQAEAIDAAAEVIERSTRNIDRYNIWLDRIQKHPSRSTAYPTTKKEGE